MNLCRNWILGLEVLRNSVPTFLFVLKNNYNPIKCLVCPWNQTGWERKPNICTCYLRCGFDIVTWNLTSTETAVRLIVTDKLHYSSITCSIMSSVSFYLPRAIWQKFMNDDFEGQPNTAVRILVSSAFSIEVHSCLSFAFFSTSSLFLSLNFHVP